jgi:hypothetical protein
MAAGMDGWVGWGGLGWVGTDGWLGGWIGWLDEGVDLKHKNNNEGSIFRPWHSSAPVPAGPLRPLLCGLYAPACCRDHYEQLK